MNCLQFERALLLAVDSEVVGELRAAFAAHLDECATCRARMSQELLVAQSIHQAAQKIATPQALRRRLRLLAVQERRNEAQTHVLAPLTLVGFLLLSFLISSIYERPTAGPWPVSVPGQSTPSHETCAELLSALPDASLWEWDGSRRLEGDSFSRFAVNTQTDLRAVPNHSAVTDTPSFYGFKRGKDGRYVLCWSCHGRDFALRSLCSSRYLARVAQYVCDAQSAIGGTL